MGAGGRSAAWVVMLAVCVACGPKPPPAPSARPTAPASLDGTWWLTDGFEGQVQGQLDFDGREMELTPAGGGAPASFSLHREGREWEAIGDRGLVVRLDPMSPDQLLLYRSDGRVGVVWRAAPLPAELGGRWLMQEPESGSVVGVSFIAGPAGRPARMTTDEERSGEVWSLPRSDGGWSMLVRGDGGARLAHLHQLPEGAWLMLAEGRARVLYRRGERPRWLAAPRGP